MSLLQNGQHLQTTDGQRVVVERLIAAGGQGEVYQVNVEGKHCAMKWYHIPANPEQGERALKQKEALENPSMGLLNITPPDSNFLWPQALVLDPKKFTFGYIMDLLEPRFQGLEKLVLGKIKPSPSFHTLCLAAIRLSDAFRKLHLAGLCYKDINLGGPFIDPKTGDVRICDNDNVRIDNAPGNIIFVFFAAPELILNQGNCSSKTDLHSLAVLLFYIFVRHHPLDGKRELRINVFNDNAQRAFYGKDPIFIFDPNNDKNRPVIGFHDQAIRNWKIYPRFLKRLFIRAFTEGLKEPNKRVRENEWISALSKLRNSLYYCSNCGIECFYDFEAENQGLQNACWRCKKQSSLPMRLYIDEQPMLLNHNTKIYAHDVGEIFNFTKIVGQVTQHPKDKRKWGLQNLSGKDWLFSLGDSPQRNAMHGASIPLRRGVKLQFESRKGEMRAL